MAFNKSHAAGYGLVSFWTAYLKAYYAPEAKGSIVPHSASMASLE